MNQNVISVGSPVYMYVHCTSNFSFDNVHLYINNIVLKFKKKKKKLICTMLLYVLPSKLGEVDAAWVCPRYMGAPMYHVQCEIIHVFVNLHNLYKYMYKLYNDIICNCKI